MNPSTLSVLLLLAGTRQVASDSRWSVRYPKPFCVVEGSTTTIPCSFKYHKVSKNPKVTVKRVVWCPNHEICRGNTPTVYDSSNVLSDSRFKYLGDRTGNCTLKIMKTSKGDAATYRFRMETNADQYAGPQGVRITVTDGEDVIITSSIGGSEVKGGGQVTLNCTSGCSFHQLDAHWSRNGLALSETGQALLLINLTCHDTGNYTCSVDSSRTRTSAPWSLVVEDDDGEDVIITSPIRGSEVRRGGQVTLNCTSACSFHQLDVHWSINGLALSETGPTLHLSNLTYNDTGNYTCSVDSSRTRTSAPWSLVVEDGGNDHSPPNLVSVAMGTLAGVIFLLLAGFVFAKRRHSAKKNPKGVDSKQEVTEAQEEVSYSTIHFKPHRPRSAGGQKEETIYSQGVR